LRPSTSSSSLLTQSGAVEGAPPNRRGAPRRADGSFVPTAFRGLPAAQSGRFVLDPIWKDGGGWAARQRVGALSHVPGVSTCIRRSADRWLRALPSRRFFTKNDDGAEKRRYDAERDWFGRWFEFKGSSLRPGKKSGRHDACQSQSGASSDPSPRHKIKVAELTVPAYVCAQPRRELRLRGSRKLSFREGAFKGAAESCSLPRFLAAPGSRASPGGALAFASCERAPTFSECAGARSALEASSASQGYGAWVVPGNKCRQNGRVLLCHVAILAASQVNSLLQKLPWTRRGHSRTSVCSSIHLLRCAIARMAAGNSMTLL
ncbi:hypothetical protein HPB47_028306, partial [Ixodes persulcatus]